MAVLIPIKKSGFISSLRFHRSGADSGMLLAVLTPHSEQVRKSPISIKSYDRSDAGEQQSGRGWNRASLQLNDR